MIHFQWKINLVSCWVMICLGKTNLVWALASFRQFFCTPFLSGWLKLIWLYLVLAKINWNLLHTNFQNIIGLIYMFFWPIFSCWFLSQLDLHLPKWMIYLKIIIKVHLVQILKQFGFYLSVAHFFGSFHIYIRCWILMNYFRIIRTMV